ncbi:MAG: HlyC/CorC family transporter [Clostridia bacterium]|nr:HlyC/CorC family transporter [Clostridia bacterium]
MDGDSIVMLLVMILLTAMSGFFSATETAFTSFNKIKMKSLASAGNKRAIRVLKLDESYDKLITTILIGNNIVNISLSTISTLFFLDALSNIINNEDLIATISTAIITIIVLIFGEISPKTIAKDHSDGYTMATSGLISLIVTVFYPISSLFSLWRKLLCKIFKPKETEATTGDDLITMLDEAEQEGGLDEDESELIRSAIEFGDLTVGSILTPRIDIVTIREDADPREIMMLFFESGFSRLPVVGESIDDIKGVLHEKDFFHAYNTDMSDISSLYQKPLYISKHHKIDDLLRDLQKEKCHMAFVIDEFGGLMGIVTMEDIIEELIGDVWDEHDEVETFLHLNDDGSLTVDCSADLDDLFDHFKLQFDDEENEKPQTVNGWVQMVLEGIPDVGDSFAYDFLSVDVTKCDEKMVKEIIVKKIDRKDSDEDDDI